METPLGEMQKAKLAIELFEKYGVLIWCDASSTEEMTTVVETLETLVKQKKFANPALILELTRSLRAKYIPSNKFLM